LVGEISTPARWKQAGIETKKGRFANKMAIRPHGGVLIDRIAKDEDKMNLLEEAESLEKVALRNREVPDLVMLATGALSPLEGFMKREDYVSVVDLKRLSNGLPWTIPITLSVTEEKAAKLKEGTDCALTEPDGHILGLLHLEEKYTYDKTKEAEQIYKTTESAHPGVQYLDGSGEVNLAGKITLLARPKDEPHTEYTLDPKESRLLFRMKGWNTVVAFQTRNPIHRAHEYIQKCALESVDGLLIHPIVGETKKGDIPADIRMKCYLDLLRLYYPETRVVLSVFPAAMRYAGPREAVFHAICRKNYGCTHFIVGRDHAGVGKYYGTYDAHYIFREFEPEEIGIEPLLFDHTFFCKVCDGMASTKTCPHSTENHITLSGTRVRELLSKGEIPPKELTRPEIAEILIEFYKNQED
jgi:sulfate adenylyltransferase